MIGLLLVRRGGKRAKGRSRSWWSTSMSRKNRSLGILRRFMGKDLIIDYCNNCLKVL